MDGGGWGSRSSDINNLLFNEDRYRLDNPLIVYLVRGVLIVGQEERTYFSKGIRSIYCGVMAGMRYIWDIQRVPCLIH